MIKLDSKKKQQIQEARAKGEWKKYAMLHYPYTAKAFLTLLHDPEINPNHVWPIIGDVWCTEIVEVDGNWVVLWTTATRGDRTLAMNESERSYVASRDAELDVWQGGGARLG